MKGDSEYITRIYGHKHSTLTAEDPTTRASRQKNRDNALRNDIRSGDEE